MDNLSKKKYFIKIRDGCGKSTKIGGGESEDDHKGGVSESESDGDNDLICPNCFLFFSNKENLKRHIINIHRTKNPKRKDIRNISCILKMKKRCDPDPMKCASLFAHTIRESVLIFKQENQAAEIATNKIKNMIGIKYSSIFVYQTEEQRAMMEKGRDRMLFVNGTHGTSTDSNITLITIMVRNPKNNKGYPVAFFLVSDNTAETIKICFHALMEKARNFKPAVIMMDDNKSFFDALNEIFRDDCKLILCNQDIFKSWERKICRFVKDRDEMLEMLADLKDILKEKSFENFRRLVILFRYKFREYEEIINYLNQYYFTDNRIKRWAQAAWNFSHADTDRNMVLENFHNVIKGKFFKRTTHKGRLDDLMIVLRKVEMDYYRSGNQTLLSNETPHAFGKDVAKNATDDEIIGVNEECNGKSVGENKKNFKHEEGRLRDDHLEKNISEAGFETDTDIEEAISQFNFDFDDEKLNESRDAIAGMESQEKRSSGKLHDYLPNGINEKYGGNGLRESYIEETVGESGLETDTDVEEAISKFKFDSDDENSKSKESLVHLSNMHADTWDKIGSYLDTLKKFLYDKDLNPIAVELEGTLNRVIGYIFDTKGIKGRIDCSDDKKPLKRPAFPSNLKMKKQKMKRITRG